VASSVALPIATAAQPGVLVLDAELIELGTRFEPLLDRYYVAHRRWSASLAQAHAEHDGEFGSPAERDYQYPPEIAAAFSDSCERSGANEADDVLSAICEEMRPFEIAINAASVTSIEGLRAKALVAFREVSPLGCGNTEFTFEDAYPFQQLFTAVAELCGLTGKIAATGYELPVISIVDDDSDERGGGVMADVVKFPGTPSGQDSNDRHAQAFCDLEGDVCDLERMGHIARDLMMECSAREDSLRPLELATFAVWQLAKMTQEFRESYYKRYHGGKQGAS
jgi:hypothetical protein